MKKNFRTIGLILTLGLITVGCARRFESDKIIYYEKPLPISKTAAPPIVLAAKPTNISSTNLSKTTDPSKKDKAIAYVPKETVFTNNRTGKRKLTITIDPGHGGEDFGGNSKLRPYTYEKILCLTTSMMLRDHLNKMGYRVVMSRESDDYIALLDRVDYAHKRKSSLFVSVHFNTAPSVDANGIEVFYFDEKGEERSKESKKLATAVLAKTLGITEAKSRGIKHGNLAVIRETEIPAVLIEGGFLTNSVELKQLKDPAYLNKLATGIAQGIDEYLKKGGEAYCTKKA